MNIMVVTRSRFIRNSSGSGVGTYNKNVVDFLQNLGAGVDVIYSTASDSDSYFERLDEYIDLIEVNDLKCKILDAIKSTMYDLIECGCVEGLIACISLNLHKVTRVAYRVHTSAFDPESRLPLHLTSEVAKGLLSSVPEVFATVAVPGRLDAIEAMRGRQVLLPLPLSSIEVEAAKQFKLTKPKQEGVVYVARYEDCKQPEVFAELVPKDVPVTILTSSPTSARRWTALLKSRQFENFEVRYGLKGLDKYAVISACKLGLSTSKVESFGLGILESAIFSQTIILESYYPWHKNFDAYGFSIPMVKRDQFATAIKKALKSKTDYDKPVDCVDRYNDFVRSCWVSFLKGTDFRPVLPKSSKSELSVALSDGAPKQVSDLVGGSSRKLAQLYAYHNTHGLKSKGTMVKSK